MNGPSEAELRQLAEFCGILPEYTDIDGALRPTSAETRRALLEAMGIDCQSAGQVRAAIEEYEHRPWQRVLPPACVVREAGPASTADDAVPAILLSVPARLAGLDWRFSLTRENGGRDEGSFRPEELPLVGQRRIDDVDYCRYRWRLPPVGCGYHRLELRAGGQSAQTLLIVTPARCFLPPALQDGDGRVWGPSLQLYALRSHRDWGIGDFGDLGEALDHFGRAGAGTVGLGPLHALYPHEPRHASPYSPSSRLFWNILYIDVERVPGFHDCEAARARLADPAFRARIAAARDEPLIDYPAVAAVKREVLELLYADFRERELAAETDAGRAFRQFQSDGGQVLHRHALYEALAAHFRARDAGAWGWPAWPDGYERPGTDAVREFESAHRERIDFYAWLQWLAERQIADLGRQSAALGLSVGLYLDLPLGADIGGSELWSSRDAYARGATIGAPPDDFNLRGQNWGLPPWIPDRLSESAYRPFIELLRRNMRHAGALRLDHVMGLMRLFWVPAGADPVDGAYVRYPLDDLLGILALESQRNQCMVIGEDLGTVPGELRDRLASIDVLSNRLFYFEKAANGEFLPPSGLPRKALVSVTNHDLPTLRGYWLGEDIRLRERLELFPSESQREQQVIERAQDRARLLLALRQQDLLPEGLDTDPARVPDLDDELMVAIHRYLARGPSMLLAFQLDDAFGMREQVNLPGTTDEHPNWRRKLPVALEHWAEHEGLGNLLFGLREERGVESAVAPEPSRRRPVIPSATYRLQLNADFGFADVTGIVHYLRRLGISHCYLSPYLKARPGSSHGYDVIDHRSLNPEIGDRAELETMVRTLRDAGMGQIADVVPNHMAVMGSDNDWWLDVLENGQASPYAAWFDIDWRPVRPELRDRLLIPVLGDHYGRVLERGELKLEFDEAGGQLRIQYFEHRLPLDPGTYGAVLDRELDALAERLGPDSIEYAEYLSVLRAFEQLPARQSTDPERQQERQREKEIARRRLADLCRRCPEILSHVQTNVAMLAGRTDRPESFAGLHELMQRQAWRVAFWQVAADEINYRRFFDINELAGLRMEQPGLLAETHALIGELYRDGLVDGLRIDHPDGLYDPADYYDRLQAFLAGGDGDGGEEPGTQPHCYVLVEKILATHEHLREDWAVHGSTGYDFACLANGLFVRPDAEREINRGYRAFTGEPTDFDELLYRCKKLMVRVYLSSELTTLANLLNRITEADWQTRDFTLNGIRDALTEIVACFPVYRTYVTPRSTDPADREYVNWAIAWARQRDPASNPDLYDFIQRLLLLDLDDDLPHEYRQLAIRFAMKFQQYTAPVTAKALEDTSFYRYCRLLSLNEVGGDPRQFGISVAAFHRQNQERARRWPHSMLAGSTHDNKRSEDVRARLNVLTEFPSEWTARLRRWRQLNRRLRKSTDDRTVPTRRDEYLFYQTLFGIWPLEFVGRPPADEPALDELTDRLVAYMRKAVREAKQHSSWMRPDEAYESALETFIRASLEASDGNRFIADVADFAGRLAPFGLLNGLSQTALRLTSPGMPDVYQGNETWDFSLVDPDNRRPVDFAHRDRLLANLEARFNDSESTQAELVGDLMRTLPDGRAKLYLCWRLLQLRAAMRQVFDHGDYLPLPVHGERADHVCAFARRHNGQSVIVAAGRWFAGLRPDAGGVMLPSPGDWRDTRVELPEAFAGQMHNVLNAEPVHGEDGSVMIGALLSPMPVAVLTGQD